MARLDDVVPFLNPAQVQSIHGTIDRAWKTAKVFMDPQQEIVIVRPPAGGGPPVEVGRFTPIRVDFGLRENSVQDGGTPITRASGDGDMRHEADVFDLRVDDRFKWQGRQIRVSAVYPPEFGVVTSEIELLQ